MRTDDLKGYGLCVNSECWKYLLKAIEKCASRYKKINTPDWLELTEIGLSAIKENHTKMFDWCYSYLCAKKSIRQKYDKWRRDGYYEPKSMTSKITHGEFGLEYKEIEVSINNIIDQIIKYCPVCGNKITGLRKKYCSNSCRQKKYYWTKK